MSSLIWILRAIALVALALAAREAFEAFYWRRRSGHWHRYGVASVILWIIASIVLLLALAI